MGRKINISHSTSERWLNILKQAYLWFDIPPYSGNTIKRLSQKKGYFCDTGLACHLQGITSATALSRSPLLGALFETFCVQAIKAISEKLSVQPKFYHWRTNGGVEVDLILERDGCLYPIEIKCKSQLSLHDAKSIKAFREIYSNENIGKALILHAGTSAYAIDRNTLALPWNAILS